jgi:glycosyltransferase involved in cell wall biosynthesis
MVFLSRYAKQAVERVTGKLTCKTAIIPHGLNLKFYQPPKRQKSITSCDQHTPFRLIYVSIIDQYKHQWHVVEAVASLRRKGFPLVLELIGPAYLPALSRLKQSIERHDPARSWVFYHETVPYNELHEKYLQADLGIFASSCETFGLILLEMMGAGMPIACSKRSAMPEILGDAGLYFDPEKPETIAEVLRKYIHSPELRAAKAKASYARAQTYSWHQCADSTLSFIASIMHKEK